VRDKDKEAPVMMLCGQLERILPFPSKSQVVEYGSSSFVSRPQAYLDSELTAQLDSIELNGIV